MRSGYTAGPLDHEIVHRWTAANTTYIHPSCLLSYLTVGFFTMGDLAFALFIPVCSISPTASLGRCVCVSARRPFQDVYRHTGAALTPADLHSDIPNQHRRCRDGGEGEGDVYIQSGGQQAKPRPEQEQRGHSGTERTRQPSEANSAGRTLYRIHWYAIPAVLMLPTYMQPKHRSRSARNPPTEGRGNSKHPSQV
jgi:hypothetical protein